MPQDWENPLTRFQNYLKGIGTAAQSGVEAVQGFFSPHPTEPPKQISPELWNAWETVGNSLPQGGAHEAIIPRGKNFGPFMERYEEAFNKNIKKGMSPEMASGLTYDKLRYEKLANRPETRYTTADTLRSGELRGGFAAPSWDHPQPRITIPRKALYPLEFPGQPPEMRPQSEKEYVESLAHEAMHNRQYDQLRKLASSKRGYEMMPEEAGDLFNELYNAFGDLVHYGVHHLDKENFPPPEQMNDYVNNMLQNPNVNPFYKGAVRRVLDAGFEPKDFPELIKYFKPRPTDNISLNEAIAIPNPKFKAYVLNPFEQASRRGGLTASKSFEKFKSEDFPAQAGISWGQYQQGLAQGVQKGYHPERTKYPRVSERVRSQRRDAESAKSAYIDQLTEKMKKKYSKSEEE